MDEFTTPLEGPLFPSLLDVCRAHGIDPMASAEMERHFVALVSEFHALATPQDFAGWLGERLVREFQSVAEPPLWVQGAEWPFNAGRPMVFVGQFEIAGTALHPLAGASFYVFWSPISGERSVVMQRS